MNLLQGSDMFGDMLSGILDQLVERGEMRIYAW